MGDPYFIALTVAGGVLLLFSCCSVAFLMKITREFKDEGLKKYYIILAWILLICLTSGSVIVLFIGILGIVVNWSKFQ